MKIVRLVLLLSVVGLPAACNSATVTEPENPAATSRPSFDGGSTTPPDTTSRDGGGVFGSGT
jgi:hypothetical protein